MMIIQIVSNGIIESECLDCCHPAAYLTLVEISGGADNGGSFISTELKCELCDAVVTKRRYY